MASCKVSCSRGPPYRRKLATTLSGAIPSTSKQTIPDESVSARGVCRRTRGMARNPSFSWRFNTCTRLAMRPFPRLCMQTESASERPRVIERVIAAGCHELPTANVWALAPANQGIEHSGFPRWDRRSGDRPGVRPSPQDARPSRSEHPFVCARGEEVAAEIGERRVFDPKTMDAVHAQIDSAIRSSLLVHVSDDVGDRSNRRFHPGTGMHPRHRHDARRGADAVPHSIDDFIRCRRERLPVHVDAFHHAARAFSAYGDGSLGGVVIVARRQNLVARRQLEPGVKETEPIDVLSVKAMSAGSAPR